MLQQNKENREIRKLSKERMKEHINTDHLVSCNNTIETDPECASGQCRSSQGCRC